MLVSFLWFLRVCVYEVISTTVTQVNEHSWFFLTQTSFLKSYHLFSNSLLTMDCHCALANNFADCSIAQALFCLKAFLSLGLNFQLDFQSTTRNIITLHFFFQWKACDSSLPPLKELRLGFPSNPGQCLLVQSLWVSLSNPSVLDTLFKKMCKKNPDDL